MTAWIRSSRCDSGTCVEARRVGDVIEVRDSKADDGPVLRFTPEEWAAFTGGVRAGEFEFEEVPA
ncbi:DUF397 domain-containing protein [Lysinibacillus fusiformis]|uniref:DUF397 domain-containing protein n=1 Tax=Lysinibacillus fusiformis TaxID=28031 RepID=UPI003D021367